MRTPHVVQWYCSSVGRGFTQTVRSPEFVPSSAAPNKPHGGWHTYNPGVWVWWQEDKNPVSSSAAYCVWGQPELYETKFEVSLSYMSLSQNPKENTWLIENSVHIPEVDLG